MSNKKSILMAFFLNFFFAIFELLGGFFSKSVAIMSDALHDAGDALSIGLSYFLERKSEKKPNADYTFELDVDAKSDNNVFENYCILIRERYLSGDIMF